MKQEMDKKTMAGIIATIVAVIAIFAFMKFRPQEGQLTAAEAGMGKPMAAGQRPGQSGTAVQMPSAPQTK